MQKRWGSVGWRGRFLKHQIQSSRGHAIAAARTSSRPGLAGIKPRNLNMKKIIIGLGTTALLKRVLILPKHSFASGGGATTTQFQSNSICSQRERRGGTAHQSGDGRDGSSTQSTERRGTVKVCQRGHRVVRLCEGSESVVDARSVVLAWVRSRCGSNRNTPQGYLKTVCKLGLPW
jgi:hypothetical protein